MNRPRHGLGAIIAVMALAACGSTENEVDRDAWAADLAQHMDVVDTDALDRFQDLFIERCEQQDEDGFALMAAMDLDSGRSPEWVRVNVEHACPDRLDELDETLTLLGY